MVWEVVWNMSRENEIWDVEGHSDFLHNSWGSPENRRGRHWEHLLSVGKLIRGKTVLDQCRHEQAACQHISQGHLPTETFPQQMNYQHHQANDAGDE